MFKDSKINKSPIDSILQESYGHLPSSSVERDNNQALHNERVLPNSQFKTSAHNCNINIQQQLKFMQLISTTQLEISLDTILAIFRNKIANQLSVAMPKIKRAQLNKNAQTAICKADKALVLKKTHLLYQKIQSLLNIKKIRILGSAYSQMYLFSLKNQSGDKSTSIVSPYRENWKMENIQRSDSEWQLAQSQGCIDSHQNLTRQNRFLKKKKDRIRINKQDFVNKIDQILSVHEAFLCRK